MKQETIISEAYLHIGDRVAMQMDEESRGWGVKGVPDGTQGTVVGFYRYQRACAYSDLWLGKKPGFYEMNGAPFVLWDNGEQGTASPHHLVFLDSALLEIRRYDKAYIDAFKTNVYVGDLPELPYMEGDTVHLVDPYYADVHEVLIDRIDYDNHKEMYNDGIAPYPIYSVTPLEPGHGRMTVRESMISHLIKRGNYWAWYKNNKEGLSFASLKEEAAFYKSLGFAEELRNPRTNDYGWTIEEALNYVCDGHADAVEASNGLFGSGPRTTVYKFKDLPDLSMRLREETIKQCRNQQR